jgi:hypothetical protein
MRRIPYYDDRVKVIRLHARVEVGFHFELLLEGKGFRIADSIA